jgi:hypothetical protein
VAPVSQLVRSADEAKMRGRLPRALELYERALVLAETTMAVSTLLAAMLLQQIIATRVTIAAGGTVCVMADASGAPALIKTAWRDDEQLLRLRSAV